MLIALWVLVLVGGILIILGLIAWDSEEEPDREVGYVGDGDTVVDLVIQPEELRI